MKLNKYLPSTNALQGSKGVKFLKKHFHTSGLWAHDCQAVARGVAAGLAGSVIPGFQLFYAAVLAIVLRGNLPIALVCTFITNPLTVIPFMYFISFIGNLILMNERTQFVYKNFQFNFSSWHAFWSNVSAWALQFGKSFLVGLPIVSLGLGLLGYFGTVLFLKFVLPLLRKHKK